MIVAEGVPLRLTGSPWERGASQAALRPEKQALLARREGLERQIDDLKLRKAALPTPEYRKQLQALFVKWNGNIRPMLPLHR